MDLPNSIDYLSGCSFLLVYNALIFDSANNKAYMDLHEKL